MSTLIHPKNGKMERIYNYDARNMLKRRRKYEVFKLHNKLHNKRLLPWQKPLGGGNLAATLWKDTP